LSPSAETQMPSALANLASSCSRGQQALTEYTYRLLTEKLMPADDVSRCWSVAALFSKQKALDIARCRGLSATHMFYRPNGYLEHHILCSYFSARPTCRGSYIFCFCWFSFLLTFPKFSLETN